MVHFQRLAIILLAVGLGFFCFTAQAQEGDESSPHIYLKSGEYLFGDEVRLELNTKGRLIARERDDLIIVDGERFSADNLLFFHDGEEYFAYIGEMAVPTATRTLEGRISLYQAEVTSVSRDGLPQTVIVEYFNKDKEPAQRFHIDALEEAIKDYPPALESIALSRNYGKKASITSYSALGFILALGIKGAVQGAEVEDFSLVHPFTSPYANLGLHMLVPAGLYVATYIYIQRANDYLYRSIEIFNRQ